MQVHLHIGLSYANENTFAIRILPNYNEMVVHLVWRPIDETDKAAYRDRADI